MASLADFLLAITHKPDYVASWEPLRSGCLEKALSTSQHICAINNYLSFFPTDPRMGAIYIETLMSTKSPALYTELRNIIQISPTATIFLPLVRNAFSKVGSADSGITGAAKALSLAALTVLFAPYDVMGCMSWKILCNIMYANNQLDLALSVMELLSTIPLVSIQLPDLRPYIQLSLYCRLAAIDPLRRDKIVQKYGDGSAAGGQLPASGANGEAIEFVPTLEQLLRFCTVATNYSMVSKYALRRHTTISNAMSVYTSQQGQANAKAMGWQNNSIPNMAYVHTTTETETQVLAQLLWNDAIDMEMQLSAVLVRHNIITEIEAARRNILLLETAVQFQPNGTNYFALLTYLLKVISLGHETIAYNDSADPQYYRDLVGLVDEEHWSSSEHGSLLDLVGGRPANLWERVRYHIIGAIHNLAPRAKQVYTLAYTSSEPAPYGVFEFSGVIPGATGDTGNEHNFESSDDNDEVPGDDVESYLGDGYRRPGCEVRKPAWHLSTLQRCQGIQLISSVPNEFYSPHPSMQNNTISNLIVLVLDSLHEMGQVKSDLYKVFLGCLGTYGFTSLNLLACGAYIKHSLILEAELRQLKDSSIITVAFGCCDYLINSAVLYHYYNVISATASSVRNTQRDMEHDPGGSASAHSHVSLDSKAVDADDKNVVYDCVPIRAFTIFVARLTEIAINLCSLNGGGGDVLLGFLRSLFNQSSCFITCVDRPPILNLDVLPLLYQYVHMLFRAKHLQEVARILGSDKKSSDLVNRASNSLYLQCPPLTLSVVQGIASLISKTLNTISGEFCSVSGVAAGSFYRPEIYTLFPVQESNTRLSVDAYDVMEGILQRFSRDLLFVQRSSANVFKGRTARSTEMLIKRTFVACGAYLLADSEIGFYSAHIEKNEDVGTTTVRHNIAIANKSRAKQAMALSEAIDYSALNTLYPLANLELKPMQEGAHPLVRIAPVRRGQRMDHRGK